MNQDLKFANKIRSSYSKKFLAFLISMFVLTAGFIVLIALVEKTSGLAIVGYIMCGAFNIISIILIINTVFDYVEVDGEKIIKVVAFVKKEQLIKKITKIEHKDNFYLIYISEKLFTSLNDRDPETAKMLFHFEKCGIDISHIQAVNPTWDLQI